MQELIVKTEKMVHGGQALARSDRFVVFVDDALPGETLRVEIYKRKKSFAFARSVEVLEPAPDRIPSDCPLSGRCGGCSFRHCSYASQLRYKRQILVDSLHSVPAAQALVADVVPSPLTEDYRNKMVFSFGQAPDGSTIVGLHRRGSFITILPANDCHLQSEASREILRRVTALCARLSIPAFHEIRKTPGLRLLTIREGRNTAQRMVELVATGDFPALAALPDALLSEIGDLADVVLLSRDSNPQGVAVPTARRLLKGNGVIEETLNGIRFRIGPDTFFQSNTAQAERLFARLREAVAPLRPDTALDLFAGTGPIALHLASVARSVYALESWAPSVDAARENALLNHLPNGAAEVADINSAPPANVPDHFDLVVVDPPRPGLTAKAIDWLLRRTPSAIAYVSCNPSTLARDLAALLEKAPDFAPVLVEPFDLFPHTAHLETLVLLRRNP